MVCRYSDKAIVLLYYLLALVAISAFILFVYASDSAHNFFMRLGSPRDEWLTAVIGCSAIWMAVLADFLLQIRAFLLHRPAIVVNERGVAGLHGGLWREIAWGELHEVEVTDKHIRFVREPRNDLTRVAFAVHRRGFSRFRLGEYAIHVLLKRIDGSRQEIVQAVRRHRPDLV